MDEEKFEIITLLTNEETGEAEQTMHNRLIKYIPTEFQWIAWGKSWKKCHCGRVTGFTDSWCPSCGQHLGRPELEENKEGV